MGDANGISIWDFVSDRVYGISGPDDDCSPYYWRDMMTSGHYLYVVSECTGTNEGLMIIDLQYLPDSLKFIGSIPTSPVPGNQNTSHNLSIDSVKSVIYLEGNGDTRAYMHSLSNPESPQYLGAITGGTIHDLFVRNDTAYLAQGGLGSFSIWEIRGLLLPVNIALFEETLQIPEKQNTGRLAIIACSQDLGSLTRSFWPITASDLSNG